jgi:hypothetical protein
MIFMIFMPNGPWCVAPVRRLLYRTGVAVGVALTERWWGPRVPHAQLVQLVQHFRGKFGFSGRFGGQ